MMKQRLATLGSVALVIASTLSAAAQEKVVRVYNWSDYIDDSILKDFTAETGIEVVYDTYDSNEILETKLLAGGTGYDVVVPSAEFLSRQIQAGVFQKLDASKLTNIGNMWDVVQTRVAAYDPGNEYSVTYMWGTTGIGINDKKVAELLPNAPTDSWALVFDPGNAEKLAGCGIDFMDSANEMIPAALNYLGLDPNSVNTDDFAKAEELLLKVRPYVRKFHSSEYINGLANGDICVAIGYSGDVFQARDRAAEAGQGVEISYRIPKEGALMWFDQMAMPSDAPNAENALTFINYMMRPEVIAKATDVVSYANGNKPAQELISKDILADKAIYPDEATLQKLYTKLPYDAKTQRLATRAFTTVKTGQ
ncbi:MAG: polyamine ABC transporter substrate-binding protein [Rhizobiaceae bacterium]|nr:polyamine ABC transporter substrate-binding protein [Rhizobiaceae bacterium]